MGDVSVRINLVAVFISQLCVENGTSEEGRVSGYSHFLPTHYHYHHPK